MGLPQRSWIEKTVNGIETFSGKENFLGEAVCKEGQADSDLRHGRTHLYWFPLKKLQLYESLPIANSFDKIYWMTVVDQFKIDLFKIHLYLIEILDVI